MPASCGRCILDLQYKLTPYHRNCPGLQLACMSCPLEAMRPGPTLTTEPVLGRFSPLANTLCLLLLGIHTDQDGIANRFYPLSTIVFAMDDTTTGLHRQPACQTPCPNRDPSCRFPRPLDNLGLVSVKCRHPSDQSTSLIHNTAHKFKYFLKKL
jgi:hypothetical protein